MKHVSIASALRFLISLTNGHKKALIWLILIGSIHVPVSLSVVWALKWCIDVATGDAQGSLWTCALLLVTLAALRLGINLYRGYYASLTETSVGNDIRHTLFSNVLYIRWIELYTMQSGDVLTRLIKDSDDVIQTLVTTIPIAISSFLQLLGVFVLLLWVDVRLALILAIAMPVLLFLSKPYWIKMRNYSRQIKATESQITEIMEESLRNQVVIQTYQRQPFTLSLLNTQQKDLFGKVHQRAHTTVRARLFLSLAFTGGYMAAFIRGAYGIAYGTVTFGTLTALLQLVNYFQRPLMELMRLVPSLISTQAAIDRLIQLSELEQEEKETDGGNALQEIDSLTLQNVTFSYPDSDKEVIKDLSLTIAKGEIVALMGETGAGKTTLLRLLLGLLRPQQGSILLEHNHHLSCIGVKTRANFVYVPQGNTLFDGTIRSNLLLGNPNATDQEMWQALETAQAQFVRQYKDGLDSAVGRGGIALSEGQAQRISIARALLRPGKILLLDEATSALDTQTEAQLLSSLRHNLNSHIVLFITHHPPIAQQCTRIHRL